MPKVEWRHNIMKFRNTKHEPAKTQADMTPMIDVVFQLLTFFMLTLRIVAPEGDFNINMPIGAPSEAAADDPLIPDIKVRLIATEDGDLASLQLNRRDLGSGPEAFERLNLEILHILGNPADPANDEIEVEIDADYQLDYRHTISAMAAARGRVDPTTGQIISYIEKIKFAPPNRPAE